MSKVTPKMTQEGYFRALALAHLSSVAHEQSNMLDEISADEASSAAWLSAAFNELATELHKKSQQSFPLYPHDHFQAGQEWARSMGYRP